MFTIAGTEGTNDDDVIYTSVNVDLYADHVIEVTAGTVTVEASLDGENYSGDLFTQDLQVATRDTYVATMTGANKFFRLPGRFKHIRIRQSGATASNARITHRE